MIRPASLLALAALAISGIANAQPNRPGTLVNAEPVTDTPAGAQAWRIRYISSDERGRPIEVTGMVLAPREAIPAQPRPVLAWTHGTWGVAEKCAPSLGANFYKATPAVDAVRRGYVVVAPDYQGLGSPGPHPFLVGPSAARNTLDAVRAAQGISGASSGKRFAVWGESQGGHAALWTGQEARRYAPDLQLTGVAAAVPPTDLIANMRQAKDQNARAFLMAYIIDAWSQYYGIPDKLVRPLAARTIRNLAQQCVSLESRPKLGTLIGIVTLRQALTPVDLGTTQPWARHAQANSVPARSPGVPVFIATSDGDTLVSSAVVTNYARRFCSAGGGRLRFVRLAKADHPGTTRETATQTLDWIDARFAGRPAPSDCGKF